MQKNTQYLQSYIDYIKTNKIAPLQKAINYYTSIKARKNLTSLYEDLKELNQTVLNFETLVKEGFKNSSELKVKVTEYNKNLIIETLNSDIFDEDFTPSGNGLIGCTLTNNPRLGISKEALELIKTYRRVGDVIGDLMGEKDYFSWIGNPIRVIQEDGVVCRDFKLPEKFTFIDNISNLDIINSINNSKSGSKDIEYKDFEQELWIELSRTGNWVPTLKDPSKLEYKYNEYFTLENSEGARFVGGTIYDKDITVLNAPKELTSTNHEGNTKVLMSKDIENEILTWCKDIFKEPGRKDIKIYDKDIMSYINPLFDLGFDNNVMNPRSDYWRMSIKATPEVILGKLKSFKREI